MIIQPADWDQHDLQELLTFHLEEAARQLCSSAFSIDRLRQPDVSFFEARDEGGSLMGCAALKQLSLDHGEIKSVRTHPNHLRKGVSRALMDHVTEIARAKSIKRLSLETHPTPEYAVARGLYERLGYTYCEPFGDYVDTEQSVYMTKRIDEA